MSFDLSPAVDLRGGRCVQLVGGVPGSEVVSLDLFVQVGGGIRSLEDAASLLDLGVDRVILGTAALAQPEMVTDLAADFGSERVMVALKPWEEEEEIKVVRKPEDEEGLQERKPSPHLRQDRRSHPRQPRPGA